MDRLFLHLLNMTITSSYVILFILIIRLFLRKAPKIFSYILWSIPFIRLTLPISFESVFSLISINTRTIPESIIYSKAPEIQSGIKILDNSVNKILPPPTIMEASINPIQIWIGIASTIWLIGLLAILTYGLITSIRLSKKLKAANLLYANIYEIGHIPTPFVFGLTNPKIYLPLNLSNIEKSYIIKHEETHIRRKDHIINFIGFLIASLHWFNPLVWLGFYLMGRDMEMSCDEFVVGKMGYGIKKAYSSSLLNMSIGKRITGVSPLAFGESNTKSRIKNILAYKKPKLWVISLSIIIITGLSISLLSNPPKYDNINRADKLYEFKNTKIGDNSKVANIIYLLEFSEGLEYGGIELFTREEPYGLKINFKINRDLEIDYATMKGDDRWLSQSLVLFTLIDNLDYIIFALDDGQADADLINIDRHGADNYAISTLGFEIAKISKDKKEFDKFYKTFESRHMNPDKMNISIDNGGVKSRTEKDKLGLTISTYNITPSGLTFVFNQSGGNPTGQLDTGSMYWLETQIENQWAKVKVLPAKHDMAWTDGAYAIAMDDSTAYQINWKHLYGELPEGNYRIGKEVSDFRDTGDYDRYFYYGYFKIGE